MSDYQDKIDLLFQYLESVQHSDKNLAEFLSELSAVRPELKDVISDFTGSNADAETWFSEFAHHLDSDLNKDDFLMSGDRIGVYQVVERVGFGGMSQIYKAERVDGQFDQFVAIKVLDTSLSIQHAENFKREKKILASLNHPGIAQIFDGGILPNGHPYFIMEFIDGMPVDQYVKEKNLSTTEILRLVILICNAVGFAHQNLIVHKDLKPQNIFVNTHGHIKLLDFGISDSLKIEGKEDTTPDKYATPGYASPEILAELPVSTSSDIYQMGLVTHKLLTGTNPQSQEARNESSIFIQEKLIGDKELLAIIKKALAHSPKDRYNSIDGFVHELENYLLLKPVDIYSTSRLYLIKKFFARNRMLGRTAMLFVFLITTLTVFYVVDLRRERKAAQANAEKAQWEAQRARASIEYLKNVFYQADPYTKKNRASVMMDSILLIAYEQLKSDLPEHPVTKAEVMLALADIFHARSMHDKSKLLNHLTIQLLEEESGKQVLFYKSRAYSALATGHVNSFQIDSAQYYLSKALAFDSLDTSPDNQYLSFDLEIQGRIYAVQRKYHKALKAYTDAIDRYKEGHIKDSDIVIAGAKSMVGEIYLRLGNYDKAENYLTEALKIHQGKLNSKNSYILNDYGKLTELYLKTNDLDKSIAYCKKSIALTKEVYGGASEKLINDYKFLGTIHSEQGDFQSAILYGEKALNLCIHHNGENRIETARSHNDLGIILMEATELEPAAMHFKKALTIKQRMRPVDSGSVFITKYNLAKARLHQGQSATAVKMLEEVFDFERKTYGVQNLSVAFTMRLLAQAYIDNNNLDSAKNLLDTSGAILKSTYNSPNRRLAEYYITLADYYRKKGAFDEGLPFAEKAMVIYKELSENSHWKLVFSSAYYGAIAYQAGNWGKKLKASYLKNSKILETQYGKREYYIRKIRIDN